MTKLSLYARLNSFITWCDTVGVKASLCRENFSFIESFFDFLFCFFGRPEHIHSFFLLSGFGTTTLAATHRIRSQEAMNAVVNNFSEETMRKPSSCASVYVIRKIDEHILGFYMWFFNAVNNWGYHAPGCVSTQDQNTNSRQLITYRPLLFQLPVHWYLNVIIAVCIGEYILCIYSTYHYVKPRISSAATQTLARKSSPTWISGLFVGSSLPWVPHHPLPWKRPCMAWWF